MFFFILGNFRAAVVNIPKTPPEFRKDVIIERRRLYEKNEGEVKRNNFYEFKKK